jgi:hypothetical protein
MRKVLGCWLLIAMLSLVARAASPQDDYTGLYTFFRDNESIQLNVEDGKLGGWVSSYGFLPSDSDTVLDRFFKQAELKGNEIHFVTQNIHGCWVEFTGHVERGSVATRAKSGYYELVGTVTEYVSDSEDRVNARQRQAVFKSMPQS